LVFVLTGAWFSIHKLAPFKTQRQEMTSYEAGTVSKIIDIAPGTTLLLKPNSRIQIAGISKNRIRISLFKGVLSCDVKKDYFSEFSVITPIADAYVTGTSFSVSLLDPALALFSVFEGSIRIIREDMEKTLIAGKRLYVRNDGIISQEAIQSEEALKTFRKQFTKSTAKNTPAGRSVPPVQENNQIITQGLIQINQQDKLFLLAKAAHMQGNYVHSLDLYAKYMSEYPQDMKTDSCWDGIATNYLFLKKYDLAIDYFRLIIKNSHSQDIIENSYYEIWSIYLQKRAYQMAADVLREYIGQEGLLIYRKEALYKLARIYRVNMSDNYRAAAIYHTYTLEFGHDENTADAHYYAGTCYHEIGEIGSSSYHFNTYLKNYPQGRWADQVQKVLMTQREAILK
ncbi:MAG: FecR domain-containing protein, partial [bacterium]